ncbi:MAG: hypothetical protein QNJ78_11035 [Gammaproteobacteria bacterium]|nr:hypothetical protein [Gammaproteobacteria bacterium]
MTIGESQKGNQMKCSDGTTKRMAKKHKSYAISMKFFAFCMFMLGIPGLVIASEYADFTKDIVEPYGLYKRSLALTSKKKNQEKAIVVVQKFINSWGMFANKYANDVPDQLSQTVDFKSKIHRPVTVGEEALAMLKAGEVKQAHLLLEEIRYSLWRMRVDAGIVSLNDKINDFHEAMEVVLDGITEDRSPEQLKYLGNRYGGWLAIKWAEVGMADSSVVDKDAFTLVIKNGHNAIANLLEMLKMGNFAEARNAGGKVKQHYKTIFFLPECS